MSIDVRFELGWQEFYAAQRFLATARNDVPFERVAGPVLIVIGALVWSLTGLLWTAVAGLALGTLLLLAGPLNRRKEVEGRWRREPLHRATHAVSFDESGIHYEQGHIVSQLDWNFYRTWAESRDAFLLICSDDVFNLIPKRAFSDERAVSAFRRLVASRLKRAGDGDF